MKIAIFILMVFSRAFATVRILTFHYNQADFIELQYKTFQKFLSDDFEMIVFNDAATQQNEESIQEICDEYGIQCVRFQQPWHLTDPLNDYLREKLAELSEKSLWDWDASTPLEKIAQHPSVRHCHVIQYALDHFGYDHDDVVVIMDGDNFLIRPLSFRELLGSNDLVGCSRQSDPLKRSQRGSLLQTPGPFWEAWVVFIAFNPSKLPTPHELKFHVDVVKNHPTLPDYTVVDSGGAVYQYLNRYPDLKVGEFSWNHAETFRSSFDRNEMGDGLFYSYLMKFIEDIYPGYIQVLAQEHFLHFASVSFQTPGHYKKAYFFSQFIYNLLGLEE